MTHPSLVQSCRLLALGAVFVLPATAWAREPLPDLIVSSLSLSHSEAAPDSLVGVSLSVENRGPADAPAFRIAIYESDGLVVPKRGNVTRIGVAYAEHGLRAGAHASFSAVVRIPPCDKCKPGNVYAYADAWGTVVESSEDNNFRAVPIQIDQTFRPNIRVEPVTLVPDRGASGRETELRAVVRNTSPYVAYGPFKIGVYCSDDAELRKADLLLSSWVQEKLPANGRIEVKRSIKVDPRCPVRGQQVELGIVADPDDVVAELDESDNADAAPYWVFKSPDLVPGQIVLSRAEGPVGTRLVVSYRVNNEGRTEAAPFKVGVYISKDATVTSADTLAEVYPVAGLAAGSSTGTINQEIRVPKLPGGKYWVGVLVDTDEQNGELRKWNNMRAVPFALKSVNLTDKYFLVDKSAVKPGDEVELRFGLRNTGSDSAAAFKVSFYYSEDPRLDSKDPKLAELEIPKLAKGSEPGEHTLKLKIPASAGEGYRFLLMVTDDGDAVAETDEFDNIALRPVHVELQ